MIWVMAGIGMVMAAIDIHWQRKSFRASKERIKGEIHEQEAMDKIEEALAAQQAEIANLISGDSRTLKALLDQVDSFERRVAWLEDREREMGRFLRLAGGNVQPMTARQQEATLKDLTKPLGSTTIRYSVGDPFPQAHGDDGQAG